jgi:hypothetical protein
MAQVITFSEGDRAQIQMPEDITYTGSVKLTTDATIVEFVFDDPTQPSGLIFHQDRLISLMPQTVAPAITPVPTPVDTTPAPVDTTTTPAPATNADGSPATTPAPATTP